MGRAFAPQRRNHHHRPVISFKEQTSDSQPGNRCFVFLGVRIRKQSLLKLVMLPNLYVIQTSQHRDLAESPRALAQQWMNQDATMRVHSLLLAEIAGPVNELASRGIH